MKDTRSTRLPNLYWSLLELVVSASCTGNTGNSGTAWHVRRISGTAPRDDTPAGHGRPKRGKGDERPRKGPARNPIGTRCHCLLEGKTRRLVQGHPSVGVCISGTTWGWRSFWQRGAPDVVQRTQTRGTHDCVIDRVRRSTSTNPWSTRSLALLSGCRSATRLKAELLLTTTGTCEWT